MRSSSAREIPSMMRKSGADERFLGALSPSSLQGSGSAAAPIRPPRLAGRAAPAAPPGLVALSPPPATAALLLPTATAALSLPPSAAAAWIASARARCSSCQASLVMGVGNRYAITSEAWKWVRNGRELFRWAKNAAEDGVPVITITNRRAQPNHGAQHNHGAHPDHCAQPDHCAH